MMGVILRSFFLLPMIDNSEVITNINKFIGETLPNATREGMEQVCLKIEAESKKKCPAVVGTLRQSITHEVEEDGETVKGYIGSNLEYAPFVHQGTGIYALNGNGRKRVPWWYYDIKDGEYHSTEGIEPTPFIQEAIDENRELILNYFKGVINE